MHIVVKLIFKNKNMRAVDKSNSKFSRELIVSTPIPVTSGNLIDTKAHTRAA